MGNQFWPADQVVDEIILDIEKRRRGRDVSYARVGDSYRVGIFAEGLQEVSIKPVWFKRYRVRWSLDDNGPWRVSSCGIECVDSNGFYPFCIFPSAWLGKRVNREVLK